MYSLCIMCSVFLQECNEKLRSKQDVDSGEKYRHEVKV